MPYAAWCSICLRSRGKDSPHKAVERIAKPDEVQVGYSFVRHGSEQLATMLIATHAQSLYSFAMMTFGKGQQDERQAKSLQRWLNEAGIHGRVRLRSDGEPAITHVLQELCKLRGDEITLQEQTTTNQPFSIGSVGRFGQSHTAMVRTLAMALEDKFSITVDARHCMFPWIIRHAAWIINRFQSHKKLGNKTSFEV